MPSFGPVVILDTSVLAAIYAREPDGRALFDFVMDAAACRLPVCCVVEFVMLRHLGGDRIDWTARFVATTGTLIVPVSAAAGAIAADAAVRFGRGSGHPAGLNFGDCLVYGVARELRLPLLFKGDDFRHTDIEPALDSPLAP